MSQPRSPVSEFLNRINYAGPPPSKDELRSKSTTPPTNRRRVTSVADGLRSALVRSTDVARTFGSTSNPLDGTSEIRPSGLKLRTISEPLMNSPMDKSLPDIPAYLAEAYAAANGDAAPVGFVEKYLNKFGMITLQCMFAILGLTPR